MLFVSCGTGVSGKSLEGFLIGRPLSRRVEIFGVLSGGGSGAVGVTTSTGECTGAIITSAFRLTPFLA